MKMAKHIVPIIDNGDYKAYVEPFCGGAAIFFAREFIPRVELLNDANNDLISAWRTIQDEPSYFVKRFQESLHSAAHLNEWIDTIQNTSVTDKRERGFAFFASFLISWRYRQVKMLNASPTRHEHGRLAKMGDAVMAAHWRLRNTQILNGDAFKVIKNANHEDILLYLDPPYTGIGHDGKESDQSSYTCKFTPQDKTRLLEMLADTKAKFVLSEYPSTEVDEMSKQQGWHVRQFDMHKSISERRGEDSSRKTEIVVTNFIPKGGWDSQSIDPSLERHLFTL